jgi:hypothetical protein
MTEEPGIGEKGWRPSKVHPLAELFPALAPDDMASLATHIKENGLQNPIVIDDDGLLIDGRMRLAACEASGVEPRYERLNGHDAEAFIWGANTKRRQMTKGQMAMIGATNFISTYKTPQGKVGRPDQGISRTAKLVGVTQPTMTKAFLVREYAPDLVPSVIAGITYLDPAYEVAKARKKEKDWRDDGLRMVREQDPELAQRIVDGEMDVDAARKEIEERRRREHAQRDSVFMGLASMLGSSSGFQNSSALQDLPSQLKTPDAQEHLRVYFKGGIKEVEEKLAEARRGLEAVESLWGKVKK